jgi:hypothetical protein
VVTFLANNGAALDVKDANDKTPIDAALGRAGGQGRGASAVNFPETAALLEKLMAEKGAGDSSL